MFFGLQKKEPSPKGILAGKQWKEIDVRSITDSPYSTLGTATPGDVFSLPHVHIVPV